MCPTAKPPTTPTSADREHDHHELAQRLAELVVLARAREARELREQRGLHGLEAEERDARDQDAGREVADEVGLRRLREHDRGDVRASTTAPGRAPSRARRYPSAVESSEYGAAGPGSSRCFWPRSEMSDRGDRRQHEREPVQARRPRRRRRTSATVATRRTIPSAASIVAVRRRSGRCRRACPARCTPT